MKKIVAVIVMFVGICLNQGFAEVKIRVVDLQRALDESTAGKRAVVEMKRVFKVKQDEIERKKAALKLMQDELNVQSGLLSEDAKQDKLEEYQKELKVLQRHIQDSNDEMKKKEGEYVNKIAVELRELVRVMGKESGYDIILEAQEAGTLYSSASIDITNPVIERYDRDWNARNRK